MHGLVSHTRKEIPGATNPDSQCCVYLSVYHSLSEVIFQIDVPQGHGLLTMRVISLMSFLPLQDFALPPNTINSIDGQQKFMQGEAGYLSANLTKLQKQVLPLTLDLVLEAEDSSLCPCKTWAVLAVSPPYLTPANEPKNFRPEFLHYSSISGTSQDSTWDLPFLLQAQLQGGLNI